MEIIDNIEIVFLQKEDYKEIKKRNGEKLLNILLDNPLVF